VVFLNAMLNAFVVFVEKLVCREKKEMAGLVSPCPD
jgi:hypothetical protein